MSSSKMEISEVINKHSDEIMKIPGVVGLYEGVTEEGMPCIKIMVVDSTIAGKENIPEELEGYPVLIEVTGKIKPM